MGMVDILTKTYQSNGNHSLCSLYPWYDTDLKPNKYLIQNSKW